MDKKRRSRIRPAAWMVAVPATVACLVAYGWSRLPKDISYHARNVALEYADADADADALYGNLFEYEREDGLSRERFRKVYDGLVRPRLAPYESRTTVSVYRTNDSQADTRQDWSDGQGHRLAVELHTELTPEGGRLNLLDVLKPAWYAEYVRRTGQPITEATFAKAIAEGLAQDIPFLEAQGVRRFRSNDPAGKGVALDSQLRWYRQKAASTGS